MSNFGHFWANRVDPDSQHNIKQVLDLLKTLKKISGGCDMWKLIFEKELGKSVLRNQTGPKLFCRAGAFLLFLTKCLIQLYIHVFDIPSIVFCLNGYNDCFYC